MGTETHTDPVSGVEQDFTEHAGHVVNPVTEIPRYQVAPTIGGVATPEVILDASSSQVVLGVRATLNAFDIVTAGEAIAKRQPDIARCPLNKSKHLYSDVAITSLYVVGIGSLTNAGGNVILTTLTTGATIRPALLHFEFEASDNVRSVKIACDEPHTSNQKAILRVEGYSYAE